MLSLFSNPFTMIAGALLISSPIIIHLINRMRFKRVRWAAMEFLLKSQKRSRRKLIIEQLILLLLRIFMCLLAGLLLARFVGCDSTGSEGSNTLHIILIDDTLSTSDSVRGDDGQVRDVLAESKRLTTDKIATAAVQASSPQFVEVIRLSELDQPKNFGRLNPTTIEDMRAHLTSHKPSLRHVDLTEGLKAVKTRFESERNMKAVLHIVSDFRSVDWGDRTKESLSKAFEELKTLGVDVHLLDAVSPERTPQQKAPLASDNLAIVDFYPDSRIVAKNREVELTVRVRNFSNSEKKGVLIRVRVNGTVREDGTVNIPSVPPNGETIAKVNLGSGLQRGLEDEGTEAESLPERFNLISASLEGETGGIAADNVRYTVVEVRDRVPMLLIDNNPTSRGTKEAESFFLQKLFTEPIKGFDVQIKNVADLENLNLQTYASVILCDVPRLSDLARKNLEDYVKAGGGVGFFMGPSIKSDVIAEYNDKLYRKGEGLFPVPLDKAIGVDVPEDQRRMERIRRTFTFNKKLLVPGDKQSHPAMEKLYKDNRGQTVKEDEYEKFFMFVVIDRYLKVNQQQLRTGLGGSETLVYLQNTAPMDNYAPRVNALSDKIQSLAETSKWEKYKDSLLAYRTELRKIAGSTAELWQLGEALKAMLEDKGDERARRPGLIQVWGQTENAALREDLEKLRDEVRFGDPLYVSRPFGRGRVTAFLSGAGAAWNDLEGPGRAYYPPLMINMQNYLASSGTDTNLTLGSPFEFYVDKNSYDAKAKRWHLSEDTKANKATFRPIGEVLMPTEDDRAAHKLAINDTFEPGIQVVRFNEKRGDGRPGAEGTVRPDYRSISFNVDAISEGNLARANSDDVTQVSQAPLHTATDDTYEDQLRAKRRDLSESPWLYLVILLVLVFEQMMAVRLSFHTRPPEPGVA